jgi:hypothetical protein
MVESEAAERYIHVMNKRLSGVGVWKNISDTLTVRLLPAAKSLVGATGFELEALSRRELVGQDFSPDSLLPKSRAK